QVGVVVMLRLGRPALGTPVGLSKAGIQTAMERLITRIITTPGRVVRPPLIARRCRARGNGVPTHDVPNYLLGKPERRGDFVLRPPRFIQRAHTLNERGVVYLRLSAARHDRLH